MVCDIVWPDGGHIHRAGNPIARRVFLPAMSTVLIVLMLSAGGPAHHRPIPADFDLAEMASTRTVEVEDARRFLIGDIDKTPARSTPPKVRVRGAKVKLRVPIG